MKKTHPLILVFYVSKERFEIHNIESLDKYMTYINEYINNSGANLLFFVIATDGEECVECLNPVMVSETEMERFNNIIEDLKQNYTILNKSNEQKLNK